MNAIATETQHLSAEARWNKALKEIRKAGIRVKQNVMECCPSCVSLPTIFKTDDETTSVGWTYGGQGDAYRWDYKDEMVRKDSDWREVGTVYFRHTNEAGPIIAAAFRANGFPVRWDGSDYKCVEVFPNGKGVE